MNDTTELHENSVFESPPSTDTEEPIASSDVDIDDIYEAKYDVEIGTTVVADEANGSQQVMWRAEVVWTADDTDMTEVQYLAEHPAEAILGAVEESTGGVV